MQLLCPLCQARLAVDDKFAGQLVRCPTCSGTFRSPSLLDVPPSAPVTPSSPPSVPMEQPVTFKADTPSPPPEVAPPTAPPPGDGGTMQDLSTPITPAPETLPESPALPPLGDGFNHIYFVTFNSEILSWTAVAGLALIFVFSFMPWTIAPASPSASSASQKATDTDRSAPAARIIIFRTETMWSLTFMIYIVFYFLTLICAVLALLLDRKIITLPDHLKMLNRWRWLVVAGLAGIGFFVLLIYWASSLNFYTAYQSRTAIFSFVLLIQLVVAVAALLEFWLQERKQDDLPIPRIELRW